MKRIFFTIAVLGIFGVLAASVLAGGGMSPNVVLVNHPHYGGGPGGYHGGYHGGWNAYRVYRPPVVQYYQEYRYIPQHPRLAPIPIYNPYYYPPQGSFYYNSPRFSVGVGF